MPSPTNYKIGTSFAPQELTLPSRVDPNDPDSAHNKILVRRLDPQALISAGFMDNLDVLTAIVQEQHIAPKTGKKPAKVKPPAPVSDNVDDQIQALRNFAANRGNIADAIRLIDWIVEFCVVEPHVERPVVRNDDGSERPMLLKERQVDVIYTDTVDLDDKNAILAFAMRGVNDLKPFRDKRREAVVDLEDR